MLINPAFAKGILAIIPEMFKDKKVNGAARERLVVFLLLQQLRKLKLMV